VAIYIDGEFNRSVAELITNVGGTLAAHQQDGRETVSCVVQSAPADIGLIAGLQKNALAIVLHIERLTLLWARYAWVVRLLVNCGVCSRSNGGNVGVTFLTIGIAFLAIGSSGQSSFLAIGAAFLATGVAFLVRQKRGTGSK
jgi:hypothetical protein